MSSANRLQEPAPLAPRVAAALLATLVLGASGCSALSAMLRRSVRQPTLAFQAVALRDASLSGLSLDTVWRLENPNTFGLSLASLDYALFVDGRQVVAGAPPRGLQVPARGSTELRFPADVRFEDLGAVVETFLTKDTAAWRVEGHVGVKTPVGVLRLPLAHEGTFEVPKVPVVSLSAARITALSLTGATLELPVTVTNRNSYPLPVAALSGRLSISGQDVASVSLDQLGTIEGGATRTVPVPINVSLLSSASAAARAIRSGQAPVQLVAFVQSGSQRIPIRVDSLVQFLRGGR